MLDFRSGLFFGKFAFLFSWLLVFGCWNIDLNSEEVFIAFSFLFLVILAVVLFRTSVNSVFVELVNGRYKRQLNSCLSLVGQLEVQGILFGDLLVSYRCLLNVMNRLHLLVGRLSRLRFMSLYLLKRDYYLFFGAVLLCSRFVELECGRLRFFSGFRRFVSKPFRRIS